MARVAGADGDPVKPVDTRTLRGVIAGYIAERGRT